jgi:hypothetical protein
MQHEAGVANELYEAGYTVVPRTIYVEPDGHPGVVREYGEPVTDPSMEEISELEAALYRVESDGIEGWDVADDLLVMRRPDGSIYIADVGFWRKRKRARKPGWEDRSDVGSLLSGWVHKGGGDKALAQALSAGSSLFGAGASIADDIAEDIAEGDPTSFSLAIMVQTLMNAIETREAVGLYVPANLHNLLAQGFALSSQDPEMLSVIEKGNKMDRRMRSNPAAYAYASTLPAEPTRFLSALGRGPQGFAEPFPLGLHYLVEHGLAEHTNCVDASKTLYNRDTCTFGLTKTGLSRLRSMKASHDQESARRQTALFNPAWLSLEVVEAAAAAAAEQDVSERARAPGQFVDQYRAAGGDRNLLDPAWAKKRDGFVARHMAQVEASNEDLFTPDGEPTRRHLALAVWAYSPDPAALSAWLLGPIRNPAKVFVRSGILVTHYEPYDLDGAFIRVESQVYDLNGRPSTLDYDGPGQIIDYEPYDSGATLKRLVLGDPYAETRLDEYVVDTEPTEASDEYDAGYRKGFTEKRRSADRTISKWSPDRLDGWQQGRSDRRQDNPLRKSLGVFSVPKKKKRCAKHKWKLMGQYAGPRDGVDTMTHRVCTACGKDQYLNDATGRPCSPFPTRRRNGEQIGIADMTRRAASVTEDLWDRNTRDVYAPSTDGIDEMIERGWTELNDLLDEDLTVLKLVFDRRQFSAPKSAQEWARSKGYAVEPFAVTGTHLEITQAAHPHVKGAVEVVEFEPGVRALIAPTVAR